MGEHGYETMNIEDIRQGDFVLSVYGRVEVKRVTSALGLYTLHFPGRNRSKRGPKGTKVEKMRT